MAQLDIEPFYFGSPKSSLFGCYHAPQTARARDCGVVLCYPMGHEYIAAHRSYHLLAAQLSQAGFHVLRFDYYGCGDSAGDGEGGDVRQWLSDIEMAIGELRRRCRLSEVCLGGLRLGASLSMLIACERDDIDGIVLWDPVIRGDTYIAELTNLHQDILQHSYAPPSRRSMAERPTESLGFPLSDVLLSDLANLDLLGIQRKPANKVLIVVTQAETGGTQLKEYLQSTKAQVEYQVLAGPKLWLEDINKVLVPNQILQAVVSWISRMYA